MYHAPAAAQKAGLGDYWDDVEGMVRNHFTQMQFCDLDEMRRRSGNQPEHDAILKRYLGGFGMGEPTAIKPQVLGCCSANGALALTRAWQGILRRDGESTTVHLLLNRASRWLDVESHLPHEGKVVLRIREPGNVLVRLPGWLRAGSIRASVNEKPATPSAESGYFRFAKLTAGDIVTLDFALPERTEKRHLADREYTLTFRGSNVTDIQPRSAEAGLIPLFVTGRFSAPAKERQVERFVSGSNP